MKILDVNLLIYAVNRADSAHEAVSNWWKQNLQSSEVLGFPWFSIVGFIRISTLPQVFPRPLSNLEAVEQIDLWLDHSQVTVIAESPDHWSVFKDCLHEIGKGGNLIPDAHLAALAISRGATLVSCDNDFARFRHLRWENPLN